MTVPLPRHDDLMLPTLQALAALGGSGSNEEIAGALIDMLGFTDAQMGVLYPKTGPGRLRALEDGGHAA